MDIKDILIRLVQETKVDYKWRIDNAKDDSFSYSTDDERNIKIALDLILPQPEPKQKKIEKIDYDKLDIARIDPNKRQFVQAIQIAINNLRSKSNELIDALNNAIGKLKK